MPKTLLLADDSVTIQKVVGISFASEDIAIATVDNGDDAIAKARELRPDVILADVVMPGKSGYEVCEAVKADPNLRHTPVLLLTGTFEAFDEERAARVGAAGHVAKPFEAQTLVQRVKDLLAAAPPAPPPAAAQAAPPPPPQAAPQAAPPVAPQPARTAAEIPTNPELGSDQAFDFFDDNAGELSESSPDLGVGAPDPLDLDEPDAAFAFGDEDLAIEPQEPSAAPPLSGVPPRGGDATVALIPDEKPASAAPHDLDLSFDAGGAGSTRPAPVGSEDLAEATLLDPTAGSGFDVSSSDLERTEAPAPPRVAEPAPAAPPRVAPPRPDPVVARPSAQPAAAAPPQAVPAAAAPPPDPFDTPQADDGRDLQMDDGDALWADAPEDDEEPLELAPEPEPEESAPVAPAAAGGQPTAASLTPALRQELRATLEKIAWDAFGPMTEKIVHQALERVEQVAWEVVPKLAETLIQEEIRRLKDSA